MQGIYRTSSGQLKLLNVQETVSTIINPGKIMSNLEDSGEPCPEKCKPEAGPSEDSAGQPLAEKRLRVLKNQNVLRKGIFCGPDVRGFWRETRENKEIEVAVRKIRTEDCQENWLDIIQKHQDGFLDQNNVLKVFGFDEDDSWRYFAVELFQATLEQFCNGQYTGRMPSDAQVLCQIANGIDFLHSRGLAHGQLNPNTILIAQPLRMKVSEFGLSRFIRSQTKNQMSEPIENQVDLQSRFGAMQTDTHLKSIEDQETTSHPTCWMLPGSWSTTTEENGHNEIITPNPTVHGDVFAAGCILFYFLTKGSHPFGSLNTNATILENIKKTDPVNLKELESKHFAFQSIKDLIGEPPLDGTQRLRKAVDQFRGVLPLKVDESRELGRGGFGIVYAGTYEGNQVAVKKIPVALMNPEAKKQKREVEEHIQLYHENVIKLLHIDEEKNDNFRYLVLELCAGTLTNFWDKTYSGPELPPDGIVLYQIANGLHYIHSRNLVHRDVKPDNILISITTPVQMKLSDFGLVKKVSHKGTFSQSRELKGTPKWMAPEILELIDDESPDESTEDFPHGTIQSDTFAAGCVFFYFLTRGSHPFGKKMVPLNILMNKPVELIRYTKDSQGDDRFLYDLIGEMIRKKEERIALPEVIKKLAGNLTASRYTSNAFFFLFVSRFHPTKPVLACCVLDKVIFLSAANSSIPFSNWKEKEIQLHLGNKRQIDAMEWNLDGTQLAAICNDDDDRCDVIVWSYASGKILFQMNLPFQCVTLPVRLEWNPFRPNMFATFFRGRIGEKKKVYFFNSCPVDQRTFHFCTIRREEGIRNVEWISENRVAVEPWGKGIEIWEIDESTGTAQEVQKLEPDEWIMDVVWNERTKCLATCSIHGNLKIFSMDSDQPIHATKVDGYCDCLAWRPNEKETNDEGIDAARESPDNFILAAGLEYGRIVIWTPLKEETTRYLKKHSKRVNSLSFSPDGRFLASAYHRNFIIWSTENWNPVYIGEERWRDSFSWLSPSTDVPEYKLTSNSCLSKVDVLEYAVNHENPKEEKLAAKSQSDPVGTCSLI